MRLQNTGFLACLAFLMASAGCSHKAVQPPMPTDIVRTDNTYTDLEPGWRLRIIVPLLKSGEFRASDLSPAASDGALSLSSKDFVGYRVFQYAIAGRKDGLVHLKLISSEATRNGTTMVDPHPPALPFTLPQRSEHIRLVYLVRVSEVDHNMAIIAARHLQALNEFTKQFQKNPNVCANSDGVFCTWIPAGIAVRPEQNEFTR